MHGFDHVLIAYTSCFFTLKIHTFMHLDTSSIHRVHPWYLIDLSNFKKNFWIFHNTSLIPLQSIETNFSTSYLANTSLTPRWSIETFRCQYLSIHWILKLNTSSIYRDCNFYTYSWDNLVHFMHSLLDFSLTSLDPFLPKPPKSSLQSHFLHFNFINLLVCGLNLSLFLFFMHPMHLMPLRPRFSKFWGFWKFSHVWALGLVD